MFIYDNSGKLSQPGEKQTKQVIEMRKVTYINYNPKTKKTKTSEGFEIVKEITCDPRISSIVKPLVVGSKVVEKEVIIPNRVQNKRVNRTEEKPE